MEHPGETRADDLWNAIAGRLRDTLTETTYDTWFGQVHPRSYNGEQLVVEVPNDFTRDWIEGHFLDLVTRAAGETATTGAVVNFTVGERIQARPQAPSAEPEPQSQRVAPPVQRSEAPHRETAE
ncbi:MAG TPA: DnaA N-terminal domain-containing protein, partial [Gaiellaceae bacterium]|nr:DnaA N-terminal domain-containing protein [Gaiellaceae bacterium]